MRPGKSVANQSDRRDLKKLWEQLGEEPPGKPTNLARERVKKATAPAPPPAPSSS